MSQLTLGFKEIYKFRYVIFSYIESNLRHKYRRSFLGFIWSVLAPLAHYMIMGFVFSFLIRDTMSNFYKYYFLGAIFFSLVSSIISRSAYIMLGNEHFIKKIYLPKIIFVLNNIGFEIVNFSLTLAALVVLGVIFDFLSISWWLLTIPFSVFFICVFLFGIASILSVAIVYLRDVMHMIPPGLQALFFLTPIAYSPSMVPEKYQWLLKYNPLGYFLDLFREPILNNSWPHSETIIICVLMALISMTLGILTLRYFNHKIIFKL